MALTDPETCSWCTTEVEDAELVITNDGRLCRDCINTEDGLKALLRYSKENLAVQEQDEFDIEYSLLRQTEGFFE